MNLGIRPITGLPSARHHPNLYGTLNSSTSGGGGTASQLGIGLPRRPRHYSGSGARLRATAIDTPTPPAPYLSRSRAHEPPVSAQMRLATLAHCISDNKWVAFEDHIAAYPRDARVTDPRTGRPLLYHAIELHRNDFARYLLQFYVKDEHVQRELSAAAAAEEEEEVAMLAPKPRHLDGEQAAVVAPAAEGGDSLASTLLAMHPTRYPVRRHIASPVSSAPPSPAAASAPRMLGSMTPPMLAHAAPPTPAATPRRPAVPAAPAPTPAAAANRPSSGELTFRSPIRDFEGNSPLIVATRAKNTDMCEELLREWPAMLNAANVHGVTPLLAACVVGSELLVTMFLDMGASITHADHDGNTALHQAAAYNHFSIVALLVARGANFMVRNKKRWTPLDYAYSETLQSFFQDLVRDFVLGGDALGGSGSSSGGGGGASGFMAVPAAGDALVSPAMVPAGAGGGGGGAAAVRRAHAGSLTNSARSVVTLHDAGGWLSGNNNGGGSAVGSTSTPVYGSAMASAFTSTTPARSTSRHPHQPAPISTSVAAAVAVAGGGHSPHGGGVPLMLPGSAGTASLPRGSSIAAGSASRRGSEAVPAATPTASGRSVHGGLAVPVAGPRTSSMSFTSGTGATGTSPSGGGSGGETVVTAAGSSGSSGGAATATVISSAAAEDAGKPVLVSYNKFLE
ncbi:Target of rapamycin complex 2 subunit avo2 [Blastocladiella emersonii ATCC 22665]|nr:Target of rapamycin complex 2 subunit avo2 [Blastocladiella emersonii ATCC 22665]